MIPADFRKIFRSTGWISSESALIDNFLLKKGDSNTLSWDIILTVET